MHGAAAKDVDWRGAKPPFDPEWRLYGRAASDDKSSIVSFLAGFDAVKASGRKPSVNIKVIWEGEEERGSLHLEPVLRQNQALLASDLWLIGDAPVIDFLKIDIEGAENVVVPAAGELLKRVRAIFIEVRGQM